MYQIFYCCYSTDLEVDADSPVEVKNKEKVLDFALDILREPEDFFGIVDANDMTCQFCVEDSGDVWVEIPFPEKGGSYGKSMPLLELGATIDKLGETFSIEMFPGLEFRSW